MYLRVYNTLCRLYRLHVCVCVGTLCMSVRLQTYTYSDCKHLYIRYVWLRECLFLWTNEHYLSVKSVYDMCVDMNIFVLFVYMCIFVLIYLSNIRIVCVYTQSALSAENQSYGIMCTHYYQTKRNKIIILETVVLKFIVIFSE